MSRVALAALGAILISGLAGCSKSAGKQPTSDETGGGKVVVPGSPKGGPVTGGESVPAKVDETRYKLSPEEGQLAIEAPAGAKAGAETIAKVIVTPGSAYKVNTEFPTKLTLEVPPGMTLAKSEFKAGGHDKAKGDAETFTEGNLTFLVKLTPSAPGSHTVSGTFKFAVCDKAGSTCLAKKEAIAIQVAAN